MRILDFNTVKGKNVLHRRNQQYKGIDMEFSCYWRSVKLRTSQYSDFRTDAIPRNHPARCHVLVRLSLKVWYFYVEPLLLLCSFKCLYKLFRFSKPWKPWHERSRYFISIPCHCNWVESRSLLKGRLFFCF